jgi:hypothetical protein
MILYGRMIMNDEYKRMWKEAVVCYFRVESKKYGWRDWIKQESQYISSLTDTEAAEDNDNVQTIRIVLYETDWPVNQKTAIFTVIIETVSSVLSTTRGTVPHAV